MTEAEQFFWDRIAGMPSLEAEQELVLRREGITTELSALQSALAAATRRHDSTAESAIGRQIFQLSASLTLVNERIRHLRHVADRIMWRKAVKELFGQEAYERCAEWVAMNDEADPFRRQWASAKTKRKRAAQSERQPAWPPHRPHCGTAAME